jgi:nicotinamidase/pyrazinamidase
MTATAQSALLVVDVQRDFCAGGALAVPEGDRVVPPLNRVMVALRAAEPDLPVYASRDWHPPVTRHFRTFGGLWPPHCLQESRGAEFHPDLRLPPDAIVVTTGDRPDSEGYSAFEGRTADGTTFAEDLSRRRVRHLYVGGLATDYCVRASVLDARKAGLTVTVLSDAVRGVEVNPGDSARALEEMRAGGAEVATTAEVRERLTGHER